LLLWGAIKVVDVGRYNVLATGFVLVSSRASYEMVEKTIAASISHLVTMSAATSKAITWAKQHNLNLIGFAREQSQLVY